MPVAAVSAAYGGGSEAHVPAPGRTTYRQGVNPVRSPTYHVLNGRNPIAAFCNTSFANCGSQLSGRIPIGISANEGRFRELARVQDQIPGTSLSYSDMVTHKDSAEAAMIRADRQLNKFEWLDGRKLAESQRKGLRDSERHLESASSAIMGASTGLGGSDMEIDGSGVMRGAGGKSEKEIEFERIVSGAGTGAAAGAGGGALSIGGLGSTPKRPFADEGIASRLAQDLAVSHGSGGGGGDYYSQRSGSASGLTPPPMKRRRGDVARQLPRSRGRFVRAS